MAQTLKCGDCGKPIIPYQEHHCRTAGSEYSHLTAEELCERLNHMRKRLGYGDTYVTYQGKGWYHRHTSGMTGSFSERRRDLEETLRKFEERERREEAERPAKEAAERENARRRALVLAAEDMLAALQAALPEIESEEDQREHSGNSEDYESIRRIGQQMRLAITKATEGV